MELATQVAASLGGILRRRWRTVVVLAIAGALFAIQHFFGGFFGELGTRAAESVLSGTPEAHTTSAPEPIQEPGPAPWASRTFSLRREKGATFELGPCPGEQCYAVELGDFGESDGRFRQEFRLRGGGFASEMRQSNGWAVWSSGHIAVLRGSGQVQYLPEYVSVVLSLDKGVGIDLFTPTADYSITVEDVSINNLNVKVEAKEPPRTLRVRGGKR